jgi:hypothetical protein
MKSMDAFTAMSTTEPEDRFVTEYGVFESLTPAPGRYKMKKKKECVFWSLGARL